MDIHVCMHASISSSHRGRSHYPSTSLLSVRRARHACALRQGIEVRRGGAHLRYMYMPTVWQCDIDQLRF